MMQESPQPIKEHKRCSRCKKEKSLSCFNKNKRSKDGLSEYCQICARKAKNKSYYKYHEQNKKKSREYNNTRKNQLKVNALKYKEITLSIEDYDKLLKLQNGVCAICKEPETRNSHKNKTDSLSVDHNHSTNIIRGLLCHRCNTVIGLMRENIELLIAMIRYLEQLPLDSL